MPITMRMYTSTSTEYTIYLTAKTEGDGNMFIPIEYQFSIKCKRSGNPGVFNTVDEVHTVSHMGSSKTVDLTTIFNNTDCKTSVFLYSTDGTLGTLISTPSDLSITNATMTITTNAVAKHIFYLILKDTNTNLIASKKFIVTIDCVTNCDCSSVSLAPLKAVQELYATKTLTS